MKHYNVVCAVILNEGRILCMQRPMKGSPSTSGKWEFPGGKIEMWKNADGQLISESAEDALLRELREEMDYNVKIIKPITTIEYSYPDFSLSLQAFLCLADTQEFNRKEHIDHYWLLPSELDSLDWAKADEELIRLLKEGF